MAIEFPSDRWISEWEDRLQNNEEYAKASQGWGVGFNGDFIFHLKPDDRLPDDRYFFIGLEDGDVYDCRQVENPEAIDYGFAYRGDYTDWVRLTQGEVGAIDGLMSGVFNLDGDMQKVLQYSDAAVSMVETASEIDTDYKY
ncbi:MULTISPECIES: SCP2 sterol-binding domain-containing protein [unclassified Haladaptatus]|uniref:SCP2 sterol-binding domain-containing protein n=1 Tax=unclassified Haladaptatus TaxID=2622732 RepID=UPI0023E8A414|nr:MULTISPECIES: SCP2 sterol-binding domain-containing protein [unclassified Haladaptatus]